MVGESFSGAVEILKRDLGGWLIAYGVWLLAVLVVGSLIPVVGGMMLLPMLIRETTRAVAENRAPTVGGIFDFSALGNDAVTTFLYAIAQTIGMMVCCIGWPFAYIWFWYSIELAADGRVGAMDAMKISKLWASSHLGDTIGMAALGWLLNTLGASFGLGIGILFTFPLTVLAWVVYWNAVKSEVYALAASHGFEVTPAGALGVEQPFDGTPSPVAEREEVE